MTTSTKMTKPRIPAAAKRLGATEIKRCSGNVFAVSYELDASVDFDQPGKGQAIFEALTKAWGCDARVTWSGQQSSAILVDFDNPPVPMLTIAELVNQGRAADLAVMSDSAFHDLCLAADDLDLSEKRNRVTLSLYMDEAIRRKHSVIGWLASALRN